MPEETTSRVLVFRTYPPPKQSWRPWTLVLDGDHRAMLGGAGFVSFSTSPGLHKIEVQDRTHHSKFVDVTVGPSETAWVLAGRQSSTDNPWAEEPGGMFLRDCGSIEELPRSAIPLVSPRGKPQSLAVGTRNALLALTFFILVILGLAFVGATRVGAAAPESTGGVFLILIAAFIAWKIRPGNRLLRNQRGWPLVDWRVTSRMDVRSEWDRWTRGEFKPR
jgi:hypothetical protein